MHDKFDRFAASDAENAEILGESVLYLSSNWSAAMSIKTDHAATQRKQLNHSMPPLDIQKVLDMPDSDEEAADNKPKEEEPEQEFHRA